MRLIDADALKHEIATIMPSRTEVFLVIDKMPDAIVRCKDCKHRFDGCCYNKKSDRISFGIYVADNWFCADGERKVKE